MEIISGELNDPSETIVVGDVKTVFIDNEKYENQFSDTAHLESVDAFPTRVLP
jgi:hypothetical protein